MNDSSLNHETGNCASLILPGSHGMIGGVTKLAIIVGCGLLLCACTAPGQVSVNTPQGDRDNYPPSLAESPTRRQETLDAWKNFLAELGLPFATLELEPGLNTPRSLPAELAGQISITKKSGPFAEMEAKEALRGLIERARGILSGDPQNTLLNVKDFSLISFSDEGNFYRAVYRQMTYPYPIAEGYGELRISVDKKAMLLQWSSRIIPSYDLPTAPVIKAQELVERLTNREFTYTTIAGRPQSYRVASPQEISVKGLVVYPKQDGGKISVHLAYPVEVGKGTTWTVYFDAINGQELGVKQNFAS
jgi:hypothetical protein